MDAHNNIDCTPSIRLAVSPAEAAALLGVSRTKIYDLIHTDGFPAFHVGGRTLISTEGLRAWVLAQAGCPGSDTASPQTRTNPPMPKTPGTKGGNPDG